MEPVFRTKALQARTLWSWEILEEHLHLNLQVNDAGVLGMYVALLLPVPMLPNGTGDVGLKGFPVWHGRGCGPHISLLYHVLLPSCETRQWMIFHEMKIRLSRWLVGRTSMLLADCTPVRFTVARECQLHAQLRLAREEILRSMSLREFGSEPVDNPAPWDDFHITWIHWGWKQ